MAKGNSNKRLEDVDLDKLSEETREILERVFSDDQEEVIAESSEDFSESNDSEDYEEEDSISHLSLNTDGFIKIQELFDSIKESHSVLYLPSYECCGTCAIYRISNEDFGDYKYAVTFNQQTHDSASYRGILFLSVTAFNKIDRNDESIANFIEELSKIMITRGYIFKGAPSIDDVYHNIPLQIEKNSFFTSDWTVRIDGNFW